MLVLCVSVCRYLQGHRLFDDHWASQGECLFVISLQTVSPEYSDSPEGLLDARRPRSTLAPVAVRGPLGGKINGLVCIVERSVKWLCNPTRLGTSDIPAQQFIVSCCSRSGDTCLRPVSGAGWHQAGEAWCHCRHAARGYDSTSEEDRGLQFAVEGVKEMISFELRKILFAGPLVPTVVVVFSRHFVLQKAIAFFCVYCNLSVGPVYLVRAASSTCRRPRRSRLSSRHGCHAICLMPFGCSTLLVGAT